MPGLTRLGPLGALTPRGRLFGTLLLCIVAERLSSGDLRVIDLNSNGLMGLDESHLHDFLFWGCRVPRLLPKAWQVKGLAVEGFWGVLRVGFVLPLRAHSL